MGEYTIKKETFVETKSRANKVLNVLRKVFELPNWQDNAYDPFETLIFTVITQNTNGKKALVAFENLSKRFEVKPEVLSKVDEAEIMESIKVAGLHRKKAKAIKKISNIVLSNFGGSLNFIFSASIEKAREKLCGLPGVGPKTADVVLLFCAKKPTLPVDTHVKRISTRLLLLKGQVTYECVRKSLQHLFSPRNYYATHVLLILHGRKFCKAINPLCKRCPINQFCPSKRT